MSLASAQTSLTVTTTETRGTSSSFDNLTSQIRSNPIYSIGTDGTVSYNATYTISSGSPLSLDLSGGSITQADGTTATFTVLTSVTVQTNSSGVLTIGGGTNAVPSISAVLNGSGATYHIEYTGSGGVSTITASTADILKFAVASGSCTFTVMLRGR